MIYASAAIGVNGARCDLSVAVVKVLMTRSKCTSGEIDNW